MSITLLDDHLLRDFLAQDLSDDGPGIRSAVAAVGAVYRTIPR